MYDLEDIKLHANVPDDYKLTPMDEVLFNELNRVIDCVCDDYIEYREGFGSIYGRYIYGIRRDGKMYTIHNFINKWGDKDEEWWNGVMDRKAEKLLKDKYEEMKKGYWK